jgi:hypothetical protein
LNVIASSFTSKLARAGTIAVLASAMMGWVAASPAAAARAAGKAALASQLADSRESKATGIRPPGRENDSFAFDPRHDDFVMFGGDNHTTVFGDTWILHGTTWSQVHPAHAPSARTGAALVYDPATRQLLLFGGSSKVAFGGGFSNQTWVWTGCTWRQLHPATSPSPRHNADMIYDAATHDVILFGGYGGSYLNDTWSWNGTTWTQLSPAVSPSPRDTDALVYDPASQTAILYGGFSLSTGRLSDTWSWNGTTWTQLSPATSPGVTSPGWQAAYDAACGQVLLFGGDTDSPLPPAGGTWTWNGTTWTQLIPALNPPGLGSGAMTYDSTSKQVYLFGGFADAAGTVYPNDTWSWNGSIWNLVN